MTQTQRLKDAVRHIEKPLDEKDSRGFGWFLDWERDPEPETFLSRRFPVKKVSLGNRAKKCRKGNMPNLNVGVSA